MRVQTFLLSLAILIFACACVAKTGVTNFDDTQIANGEIAKEKYFKGAFSNGMKGDSIFFTVSSDNKKLTNLTFKGYWRCNGKLERISTGPDGGFNIVNGIAKGHISEPPNGGSTAWRFDIDNTIIGNKASGTFRMNINNLGCDTYLLKFTAIAK